MRDVWSQLGQSFTGILWNPTDPIDGVATSSLSRQKTIVSWSWPTKRSQNETGVTTGSQCDYGHVGNHHALLPCGGTLIHVGNALLALLLLLWFHQWNRHVPTTLETTSTSSSTDYSWSMWCIYLSQLGLVYDNGVNAMGTYLGEGQLLRILNKHRFALHVTVIPLLGITVTDIAGRYSLFDGTVHRWICSVLSGWSFLDLTKWQIFRHSQHLQLVDNRASQANQGPYLSGTLSYTSGAVWEMCIPPILLVLYELMVGVVILMTTEPSFPCITPRDISLEDSSSIMLGDKTSLGHADFACCCSTPSWSAIYLILSGLLTLSTSCTSLQYPALQLFGENLHGMLLWAAYTTPP